MAAKSVQYTESTTIESETRSIDRGSGRDGWVHRGRYTRISSIWDSVRSIGSCQVQSFRSFQVLLSSLLTRNGHHGQDGEDEGNLYTKT